MFLVAIVVLTTSSHVLSVQVQWDCMVDGNASGYVECWPTLALHVV